MIGFFLSWPIRRQLAVLLVLLAILSILLMAHAGIKQRREAIDEARKNCLRLVDAMAAEQQAVVAGAEQLATALSLLPEVRGRYSDATNALLADLLKKNPQYSNISVADKSGLVWASAVPFKGKISVADRRSFRDAVRSGVFSSGEYSIGRLVKKPVINFGYPVVNELNELVAVVAVVLDLQHSQRTFEKVRLPAGASFSLIDHRGIILIRNLRNDLTEKLVGQPDRRPEIFAAIKAGPDEGTMEAVGNDGVFRLIAYRKLRLSHESVPYLYVRSSIPLASVTSAVNASIAKNLAVLAVLFGAGLTLVWIIGKKAVVEPILLLKRASEEVGKGTKGVHVSPAVRNGELGELARTFDAMADDLARREAALRESEERWATTLASIGDGVIAADTAGRITFMNTVAENLTGWTLSQAAARMVAEVFHIVNDRTGETMEDPVARVLREKTTVSLAHHTTLIARDGRSIPVDDSGAPIRDTQGAITGAALVFRDITERRRFAESLLRSEERFRLAQDAAGAGTWEWNLATNENFWSDELWKLYGLTPHSREPSYRAWVETIHPDDRERNEETVRQAAGRETEFTTEWRVVHPDNTVHWLMSRGRPLHDARGRVVSYIGIVIDITDRKAAEERLRENKARLDLALQSAQMGAWHWDVNENKGYFDDQVCSLLGIDPSGFTGSGGEFLSAVHPDDRHAPREALARTMEQDASYETDYRAVWPDGSIHHITARGRLIRDNEGLPWRITGIIWDITARKLAEEALKASLREKETLLKEIHHRVKNNLQVMSSLLNWQSRYVSDPLALDAFRISIDRIKSMALIHDKLYRSQALSGINVRGYVSDLARGLMDTYATGGKRISLTLDINRAITMDLDTAIPLALIINELVSNAIKHGFPGEAEGTVTVGLREDGTHMTLIVADTGVGFPEGLDFRNTPSMGMQLVMVLVEQLEGTIELTREEGTKFTVTFPSAR